MNTSSILKRIVFFLSILGLFVSGYLSIVYLKGGTILCYSGGCDAVRTWAYSFPLGKLIPVLGFTYYLTVFGISLFGTMIGSKLRIITSRFMFWVSAAGLTFSLILTLTATYVVRDFCMWCIVSFALVSGIFFLSDKILKEEKLYAK